MKRITILFGGLNKERLVSVASAQALHRALPDADLWFWDVDDSVHETSGEVLLKHARPFEDSFNPGTPSRGGIARALDQREGRGSAAGARHAWWHGRERRIAGDVRDAAGFRLPGLASASSNLAFDKVAAKRFASIAGVTTSVSVALEDAEAALAEHGRLIAKPAKDGSSYGLIYVNSKQDLVAVRRAAEAEEYLIERFVAGVEATCGVLEKTDGSVVSLPPIEIIAADGGFDYTAKYLAKSTQEICPGRFAPEITEQLMDQALKAHKALSCSGYSRSDFIVSGTGLVYLETNTLPGLTQASLYPKALKAVGITFAEFLQDQIALATQRMPG